MQQSPATQFTTKVLIAISEIAKVWPDVFASTDSKPNAFARAVREHHTNRSTTSLERLAARFPAQRVVENALKIGVFEEELPRLLETLTFLQDHPAVSAQRMLAIEDDPESFSSSSVAARRVLHQTDIAIYQLGSLLGVGEDRLARASGLHVDTLRPIFDSGGVDHPILWNQADPTDHPKTAYVSYLRIAQALGAPPRRLFALYDELLTSFGPSSAMPSLREARYWNRLKAFAHLAHLSPRFREAATEISQGETSSPDGPIEKMYLPLHLRRYPEVLQRELDGALRILSEGHRERPERVLRVRAEGEHDFGSSTQTNQALSLEEEVQPAPSVSSGTRSPRVSSAMAFYARQHLIKSHNAEADDLATQLRSRAEQLHGGNLDAATIRRVVTAAAEQREARLATGILLYTLDRVERWPSDYAFRSTPLTPDDFSALIETEWKGNRDDFAMTSPSPPAIEFQDVTNKCHRDTQQFVSALTKLLFPIAPPSRWQPSKKQIAQARQQVLDRHQRLAPMVEPNQNWGAGRGESHPSEQICRLILDFYSFEGKPDGTLTAFVTAANEAGYSADVRINEESPALRDFMEMAAGIPPRDAGQLALW